MLRRILRAALRQPGRQEYPVDRQEDARTLLQSYDWPGNIRELQNVIERSVILSSGDVFSVDESWLSKESSQPASRVQAPQPFKGAPRSEREIIEAALAESRGPGLRAVRGGGQARNSAIHSRVQNQSPKDSQKPIQIRLKRSPESPENHQFRQIRKLGGTTPIIFSFLFRRLRTVGDLLFKSSIGGSRNSTT